MKIKHGDSMIDKIYENYEVRLSMSNPILKMRGIDENINELPIGVNLDIENILSPFELFDNNENTQEKIKEAYIEIFKEGIYLGIGFGKIIEFNYAKSNPERFIECFEDNAEIYTSYDFKIEVMTKVIPPISVKKFTQEENPKEVEFKSERFKEIHSILCVNLETDWEDLLELEINRNVKEIDNYILKEEMKSFTSDEELRVLVDGLKKEIQMKLFEKFFESLDIDLDKAHHISKNKLRFNEETAEDIFVSNVFSKLEGEYEVIELINKYLIYVFNEGKIIGLLNGTKMVIEDIQNEKLDYEKMNAMNPKESFDYIKEGLN